MSTWSWRPTPGCSPPAGSTPAPACCSTPPPAPPAPPASGDLLDLGCGYGPIACVLAARSPAATVWAVDVNERALELCRRNAERAGLANVRCLPPGELPRHVDAIWSNPPMRIGKDAPHDMGGG